MPVINIQPPLGGVSKYAGKQNQPPFTAETLNNFWPIDFRTFRSVLGVRPPRFTLSHPSGSGSNEVNLLSRINGVASGKPLESAIAGSNGQLYYWGSSGWAAATGAQAGSLSTSKVLASKAFLQQSIIENPSGKPYVFDYSAGTCTTMVESEGTVPDGLSMFAVWQGAVVAAGATDTPQVLYMSRIGDMTDWDFAASISDTGGAFFTAGEDEGLIRGPITAIIPHTSDTLLVSTSEGITALYGHPRAGGIFEDFSSRSVVGANAWCKGPDDTTYFLAREGFMAISPQPGAKPVLLSGKSVPLDLKSDVNSNKTYVMAYDDVYQGIIFNVGNGTYWWYDLSHGGFFKMTFPSPSIKLIMESSPVTNTAGSVEGQSNLLFAGVGGLTQWIDSIDSDETVAADATIGPVALTDSVMTKAKIVSGRVVMSKYGQGAGTLTVACGVTGEDAVHHSVESAQFSTSLDTISSLKNGGKVFPKISGQSVAIGLNVTAGHHLFEGMALVVQPAGENRGFSLPVLS